MKTRGILAPLLASIVGSSGIDVDAQKTAQVDANSDRAVQETLNVALPVEFAAPVPRFDAPWATSPRE
jgi:hypothetical protein